ncbi:hypothetical protein LDENG_00188350 [Lucifuga dentata]|nr:hypothetical protein LDENG_00188350 [Lucifuga dentata]
MNRTVGEKCTGELRKFSNPGQIQGQKTEKYGGVSSKHSSPTRMENDSCDDSQSDSGLSADFSQCSTMETQTTGTPTTPTSETPIEREIRRAIEREHSLRRSRGLPNPPSTPEYVEIPLKKNILSQSLISKSERNQSKDREFAGKRMQQEIHEEAQREQDLVKLGKVPGFYDKGTVWQLKERKQLFEAFQGPQDSSLMISTRRETPSFASANNCSTFEKPQDISSRASTIGSSYVDRRKTKDLLREIQGPNLAKGGSSSYSSHQGPGFSDGTNCHMIILENNLSVPTQMLYHAKPEADASNGINSGISYISPSRNGGYSGTKGWEHEKEEEEEDVAPKENPFFKLRSSTALAKVEQDIQEAEERERELRKQRINLYGGTGVAKGGGGGGGGGGRGKPVSIKIKNPKDNGLADLPASSSKGGKGPPAACQSLGKLGKWPPAQTKQEQISWPEDHLSSRTPRQKIPLLQRWESGLVTRQSEEDD